MIETKLRFFWKILWENDFDVVFNIEEEVSVEEVEVEGKEGVVERPWWVDIIRFSVEFKWKCEKVELFEILVVEVEVVVEEEELVDVLVEIGEEELVEVDEEKLLEENEEELVEVLVDELELEKADVDDEELVDSTSSSSSSS